MLSGPALVLLLLASCSGQEGLHVSCGSQNLAELPLLPPETTDLYLQDNRLTSVPGSFDTLRGLRTLNLTGNPFHCGCSIRYLSAWLRDHAEVTVKEPTCASPIGLAGRPIASLGQAHFSACGRKNGVFDGVILLSLAFLVLLLLWCLKTAKSSTFILEVFGRHAGFEAHTLRSRKPRHRRKRHAAQSDETEVMLERMDDDNLDAPLLNMEILPQILDVLQKKHNIKFKAP